MISAQLSRALFPRVVFAAIFNNAMVYLLLLYLELNAHAWNQGVYHCFLLQAAHFGVEILVA